MGASTYNQQLLAVQAYGWINATGATSMGFGCSMTRVTTGLYRLDLGASDGVLDGQSWTMVTPKMANGASGVCQHSVMDVSNTQKLIALDQAGAVVDRDIEVILWKTNVPLQGV